MTEINNINNNLTVEHPSAPTVRVYRPRPVAHFLRRLPVELRHEAVNYLCMLGLDAFASSGLLNHDAWQSLQVHSERTMENLRLLSKDIEPHINAHFRAITDAPDNEADEEADENNRSHLVVDPLVSPGRTSSRHGKRSESRRSDSYYNTEALKTESRMISPNAKRRNSTPPLPGNVASIIIENAANSPSAQRRREAQQHLENLRKEEAFLMKQLNGDDDLINNNGRRSSKNNSRTTSPLPQKSQFGTFVNNNNNNRLTSSTSPVNRKKHIVSPPRSQSVEFTRIITPERDDPRQRLLKTTNQSSYVRYKSNVYQQKYRMNNSNNINHGKKLQGSSAKMNNLRDESSFDEQTKPGVIATYSTFVNQVNPRLQHQQQGKSLTMINKTTFPKKVPQYNETNIPGLASRTVNNNNHNQFYQQQQRHHQNNNNTAYLQKGFDEDESSPHGLRSATIRGMAAKLKSEAEVLIKVATKMEHKNNNSRPSSAPARHNKTDEQKNQVDRYVVKSPSRRHNEVPLKSHMISQRERLQSQRELGNDEIDANIVKAPPPPPAMIKKWKEQREMELEKLRQRELEKQEELKLLNDLNNNNNNNINANQKIDTPDVDDHQFPPISRELTSSAHYSNNNLNDQRQKHLLLQQQQQQQQQIPAVQSKNISPFRRRTSDDATASVGGGTNNSTVGHNNSTHSINNNSNLQDPLNLQSPQLQHQHQQQQQQQSQRTPLSGGLIALATIASDGGGDSENMNAVPLAQTEKSFDELERSGISNRSTPRLERACKVALKLDTGEPVPIGAVPRRQQQQLQQQQQQQQHHHHQQQQYQKQQRPFISPSRVAAESSINDNNNNNKNTNSNTISPRRRNSYLGLTGNSNNNDDDVEDFENAVPVGSTTSPTPQEGKIKNASFFSESASTCSNQAQAASSAYCYPSYNYNGNSQSNNVSNNNTSGRLVLVNQQPMMMFTQNNHNNNNNKIDVSPSRRGGNSALDYVFDSVLGSPGTFVGGHHAFPASLQQQQQQQQQTTRFSPSSVIQSKARSPLSYNNNNNNNSSSNRHQFSTTNNASNNNNTATARPYPSTVFSSGGSGMFNNSSVLFGSNNGVGAGNDINNIHLHGVQIFPQQDSLTQYPSFNGSIGLAGTNNNSLAGNATPQQQSQRPSVNMVAPIAPVNGNSNLYQSQYQSPLYPGGNNSRKY